MIAGRSPWKRKPHTTPKVSRHGGAPPCWRLLCAVYGEEAFQTPPTTLHVCAAFTSFRAAWGGLRSPQVLSPEPWARALHAKSRNRRYMRCKLVICKIFAEKKFSSTCGSCSAAPLGRPRPAPGAPRVGASPSALRRSARAVPGGAGLSRSGRPEWPVDRQDHPAAPPTRREPSQPPIVELRDLSCRDVQEKADMLVQLRHGSLDLLPCNFLTCNINTVIPIVKEKGLCRKFSCEAIWGMLSPWDAE